MTYTNLTFISLIVFLNIYHVISLRSEKILGGGYAAPNEFSYHATINSSRNICGGGILSKDFVVTAAHCVIGPDNSFKGEPLLVTVGTTDIYAKDGTTILVEKIFVPVQYQHQKFCADIALLKLHRSLDLSSESKLKVLQLPTQRDYSRKSAISTGFGIQWLKYQYSFLFRDVLITDKGRDGKLKYLQVETLETEECQTFFEVNYLSIISVKTMIIDKTCLCSLSKNDGEPSGSCKGDSGGPLVINGDTILGVISTGSGTCDDRKEPVIYTRIWSFIPFILNVWYENYQNMRIYEFNLEKLKYSRKFKEFVDDNSIY